MLLSDLLYLFSSYFSLLFYFVYILQSKNFSCALHCMVLHFVHFPFLCIICCGCFSLVVFFIVINLQLFYILLYLFYFILCFYFIYIYNIQTLAVHCIPLHMQFPMHCIAFLGICSFLCIALHASAYALSYALHLWVFYQ